MNFSIRETLLIPSTPDTPENRIYVAFGISDTQGFSEEKMFQKDSLCNIY